MPVPAITQRRASGASFSGGRTVRTAAAEVPTAEARNGARGLLQALQQRISLVRVAFGLIWAIDAWYKWQPAFSKQFLSMITRAGRSAPAALQPWFHFWSQVVSPHAAFFAITTAVVETLIAAGLVFGVARRPLYLAGALFSFLIWAVPESFGRFWTTGQTDLGTSIMYVFIFLALYALDVHVREGGWSIDRWLAARVPAWRPIADL